MRVADLLEFDWEVGLFKAVRAMARLLRPAPVEGGSTLAPLAASLGHLASLVADEPLRVLPAEDAGGVRGRDLLFPARLSVAGPELDRGLYVLRAVHAGTIRKLGLDRQAPPADPVEAVAAELRVARVAAEAAAEELPRFAEAWAEALLLCRRVRPPLTSLGGAAATMERMRLAALEADRWEGRLSGRSVGESPPVPLWGALLPAVQAEAGGGAATGGSEASAKVADAIRRVTVEEKDVALQHSFEKIETIERFHGVTPKLDGADELDEELEALEEVPLGELFRGGPETRATLRAEIGGAEVGDVGEVAEGGIPYDEWDVRTRTWRRAWCRVFPRRLEARDPTWTAAALQRNHRTILALRRKLEEQLAARGLVDRQLDGDEVDVDALVDARASARAGKEEARLYLRRTRVRRDLAVLVLMDLSLSADAWVGERRVLDVTRDAVLVLGEVTAALGDPFALYGFSSETRNRNHVWVLKDWAERWASARDRLGPVEPRGYTRIGAAIRHASASLAARPERRRLLVVLTDGHPTDYDRYEGRYGVADVRMALRQAEASGIRPHALAIDGRSRAALPSMFGEGGWELLPSPELLPGALTRVVTRWSLG